MTRLFWVQMQPNGPEAVQRCYRASPAILARFRRQSSGNPVASIRQQTGFNLASTKWTAWQPLACRLPWPSSWFRAVRLRPRPVCFDIGPRHNLAPKHVRERQAPFEHRRSYRALCHTEHYCRLLHSHIFDRFHTPSVPEKILIIIS